MSENPYHSPTSYEPAVGVKSGRHEDLRSVALYQKGVLVCILIYLIAVVGQFALPPELRPFLGFGVLAVGLVGLVFVVLLSVKVYPVAIGIILGVLTVVPCLGLMVLVIINAQATAVLRRNGYRVGLLGARLSEIDASGPGRG
jgi:hypothetical protein